MKQHITIEQINELSKNGKERLRKWWKPKNGDIYSNEGEQEIFHFPCAGEYCAMEGKTKMTYPSGLQVKFYPLLSIGQMIEFLDEHASQFVLDYGTSEFGEWQKHWRLIFDENQYECDELCDALWEACKEVLEK